jgi:hypothetical protein
MIKNQGRRNKQRGSEFEREVVNTAKKFDLEAKRAWGSNGRSLGLHDTVDVVIGKLRGQCKRKKKLPQFLFPDKLQERKEFDCLLIRGDNEKPLIVLDFEYFLYLFGRLI